MTLKTRLKCIAANKFTLIGYAAPVVTFGMMCNTDSYLLIAIEAIVGSVMGVYAVDATVGGRVTQTVYEETKKLIQETGKIDDNFQRYQGRAYCEETGMYLAARELGVRDQLEKRNGLEAFTRALFWHFGFIRYYDEPRREKIRQQLNESDNLDLPNGIAQMVEDSQ
ncbi:hypothetical protein HZA97_10120 [Candidatus Woesearchaeota archaeon]|nr:hypothetical protein [Candidatus Woesearchaeota archaeon]